MKKASVFIAVLFLALCAGSTLGQQEAPKAKGWACPPCGHDHDDRVYAKPGKCPVCGMKMVTVKERQRLLEAQAREARERKKVAILLFEGVQIIDFTGPYEVFGQAHFDVFTVSETGKALTTSMKLSVNPTYKLEDSPQPDIILVPGGGVGSATSSQAVLNWLRRRAETAEYVLSVCNGAFILAEAGLLDGKTATTFYGLLDRLEANYPKVNVVRDQRYADNGKILTSAGLSAGIDASLYLVSKIHGMGRAKQLALHLEYDWRPDSDFARAVLADRQLPGIDFPDGAEARLIDTHGDRQSWTVRYRVKTGLSAVQLREHLDRQLARLDNWTRQGEPSTDNSEWRFISEDGQSWTALECVEKTEERDVYNATLTIRRAGSETNFQSQSSGGAPRIWL